MTLLALAIKLFWAYKLLSDDDDDDDVDETRKAFIELPEIPLM